MRKVENAQCLEGFDYQTSEDFGVTPVKQAKMMPVVGASKVG